MMSPSLLFSCPAQCRITDNPLSTTSTDPAAEVSIKTDKHMVTASNIFQYRIHTYHLLHLKVSFKKMVTNEATSQTNQWDLMQVVHISC